MSNWSEILTAVNQSLPTNIDLLNKKRKEYMDKIVEVTGRNVITYYSGWLKNPNAPFISINDSDMNAFMTNVYRLDRSKGLDLILHTPGGDLAATESIVNYLQSAFGGNVRAIIPQISMSAGTLIAMSCREILMGRESSLGPIDPQLGGIPCQGMLDEFDKAVNDIASRPSSLGLWQSIIGKLNPTFITNCENSIKWSKELAKSFLLKNNPELNIDNIYEVFLNHQHSYSHSRHIPKEQCKAAGLKIVDLESDQNLQDAVLSLHHCYMILFDKITCSKVVENQIGGCFIQNYSEGGK